jgi:hypothetical protein
VELDQSAVRMALADHDAASADEQQMLSVLKAEMSGLIDAVAELTAALMPRQGGH